MSPVNGRFVSTWRRVKFRPCVADSGDEIRVLFHLVWRRRIDCFPISAHRELVRLQLQLYSGNFFSSLSFLPRRRNKPTILVFLSGFFLNSRRWQPALVASLAHRSLLAVKFQFNISDIFAALMINFFVCRVDSVSPGLPTPTRPH